MPFFMHEKILLLDCKKKPVCGVCFAKLYYFSETKILNHDAVTQTHIAH